MFKYFSRAYKPSGARSRHKLQKTGALVSMRDMCFGWELAVEHARRPLVGATI